MQSSTVIGIPANDKDFEEKCVVLFAGLLNDPNVKTVGSRGLKQHGLDLLGRRDRDPNNPVGVQCKLKTKGDKLAAQEVRREVDKALGFCPPLTEYYIVTTASDDTELDSLALELSQQAAQTGRLIDIQVFGWETLQQKIRADQRALDAFDPGHSPTSDALLQMGADILGAARSVEEGQTVSTELILRKVEEVRLALPADTGRGGELETWLDQQIDEYRNMLTSGKPKTALALLETLEARLTPQSSSALRARVRGNIGTAHIRLGDIESGGRMLLEAYTLNPKDPKVIGNRVLGLILAGEIKLAFSFARETLEADPTNLTAAGFAFHAAALDVDLDPEVIVPDAHWGDPAVAPHRMTFLSARGRDADWRALAASHYAAQPDDYMAGVMAATALLEAVFAERDFEKTPALSAGQKALVDQAIAIFEPLWARTRAFENANLDQYWGLPVNLANALRAVGRAEDAEAVIEAELALAPSNPDALATGVFLAMERNDTSKALARVIKLPDSPMKTVQHLNALAREGNWAALLAVVSEHSTQEGWKAEDRATHDALVFQARAATARPEERAALTEQLVEMWPDNVAVLALASGTLMGIDAERASALRQQAFDRLDDATLFGHRLMLAQLTTFDDDFDGAIRTLDGFVPTDYPSKGLLCLAWGFANAVPRPRTRLFFEGLPSAVIERPDYARLAGAAHAARGDLAAAERHLRTALKGEPTDLRAAMLLYSVLKRAGRDKDAKALVLEWDEQEAQGPSGELMRLASMLRHEGAPERALALGYRLARTHHGDAALLAAYAPLLLMERGLPSAIGALSSGTLDAGFDLEGLDIPDVKGVIETAGWEKSYAPDHPLALALMGKSTGEEIALARPLGEPLRYRIRDVRHKYVWLMHDISARFASQFPDSTAFVAVATKDGDVQPILDLIKRCCQSNRNLSPTGRRAPYPA